MSTETQLTPTEALSCLRTMATKGVPNCVNLGTIDRVMKRVTLEAGELSQDEEDQLMQLRASQAAAASDGKTADTRKYARHMAMLLNIISKIRLAQTPARPFTEASTQEALAILDEAAALPAYRYDELPMLIESAIGKLRPQTTEEAALEHLAQKYPIDLPYLQPVVVVASDTPAPKCSPLSCDGCPQCEPQVAQGLPV